MFKFINYKLLLLLVVIIAAFLRFYQLGSNPPSLTWDEAAWGYNAYSIGIDGKDEFGRLLPHDYLESFGDFKPPMYVYLDAIPVKALGLNEFATRVPSALFGVLTVFLTYFLVQRIFWNSKDKRKYALASAFILAISPWHIMLSRAAFEANVATFFLVLGIWGFLAATQDKKWYLLISAVSFALSMYTFNTARVVAPLLVIILVLAFRKRLWQIKKEVLIAFIIGLAVFLPTFRFLLTPQAALRFQEVNIFSDPSIVKTANQEIANDQNAFWSKIIHNRRVLYSLDYVKHYFDNLSPSFLFIKGDGNPKFSIQSVGQMYLWDIPFVVIGILFLIRKKEGHWWLVPLWLLIGIIPAATAEQTPHALRIEASLPTFQIISAYGLIIFLSMVKRFRYVVAAVLIGLLLINLAYFCHDYFAHYPSEFSGEWQYGYKQSIDYVKSVEKNYDYVQVTSELGRPYIYYLFYTKTLPSDYRKTAVIQRDAFGFVTVTGFGKYRFPVNYNYSLSKTKKVLYVNTPYILPKNIKILKTFYLLNGQPVLVAYTI
ncbi:MAG TPA: glycosyltransferase family 39 protein [Patescibacteria group bacterium]|jgi:4-amino-4-deoxy-L-arabinose transferase-like glycosyltransferase|nr:glycosyltransferase family 39 protein [Patescibacteria group bacterium]